MFEEGHFFIILGLFVDLIGARMIIQPILNLQADIDFYQSPFDRFRKSYQSSFRPSYFSRSTSDDLRELAESVNKRIENIEDQLERAFDAIERSDDDEQSKETTKETKHQRYASIGYIVLAFGFFMQIAGVLLLSGIIYGN